MLCLTLCMLGLGLSGSAKEPTIVTFDVPGAGTSPGQGTQPSYFSPERVIIGWYIDANLVYHGFLRAPNGTITTFDAPGAGTGEYQGTYPDGINPAEVITGWYIDASGVLHGFMRMPEARRDDFFSR